MELGTVAYVLTIVWTLIQMGEKAYGYWKKWKKKKRPKKSGKKGKKKRK